MEEQVMDAAMLAEATRTLAEPAPQAGTPPVQAQAATADAEEAAGTDASGPSDSGESGEPAKAAPQSPKYAEFGDDPSKFVDSYRHLRAWTTRASMENANLKRQLAAVSDTRQAPPEGGDPDLEGLDPDARKVLDKYLEKKLAPLAQTVTQMTASARENAVQRHHVEQLQMIQQKNPDLYADPVVIDAFRNVLQQRPFLMSQPGGIMDAFREARDIAGGRGTTTPPATTPPATRNAEPPPATMAGKGGSPAAPKGPSFDQLVKDAAADGATSPKWDRVMEFHMRRSGML